MAEPTYPKTVVNWIPAAYNPVIKKDYLVWVRQGGSILNGKISTATYHPDTIWWEITLVEGEEIDLWADVLAPFWYLAPQPGDPPISPVKPS
jgi:hypothetical protein